MHYELHTTHRPLTRALSLNHNTQKYSFRPASKAQSFIKLKLNTNSKIIFINCYVIVTPVQNRMQIFQALHLDAHQKPNIILHADKHF